MKKIFTASDRSFKTLLIIGGEITWIKVSVPNYNLVPDLKIMLNGKHLKT